MQVDLKKIKPIGVVLILGCSILALIMCFTVDLGIPERYYPEHDTDYYTQSSENLRELAEEAEENVLPQLEGVSDCYADFESMTVVVVTDSENSEKVLAVLERDFGKGLFNVITES
jgi:hypothetical protein